MQVYYRRSQTQLPFSITIGLLPYMEEHCVCLKYNPTVRKIFSQKSEEEWLLYAAT